MTPEMQELRPEHPDQPLQNQKHYPRLGLLSVIVFFILVLLIYGFFTSYNAANVFTSRLEYIMTNVLAVLGFGLLLVQWRFALKQTLTIALLVCMLNVLMGPMLQQFWFNVFSRGFPTVPSDVYSTNFNLMNDTSNKFINNVTLGFVRISTFCSISLLVALTGIIGKIGLFNTVITTVIFNIGFNMNYYLNFNIFWRSSPSTQYFIMDDYQGSRVFAFGAAFGLALLLVYHRLHPILNQPTAQYTQILSSLFTLLGTTFVLSLFYFLLDTYAVGDKAYALLNIYFAFSASILSSVSISLIFGRVVTFQVINMAVLSGAIQISIIGTFIKTPYVAILVGAFAGIITALLSLYLHPRINSKYIKDSKGVIVIYLINVFLCSYFVCPIIIKAYENLQSYDIYNEGYHMVYTSISLGLGFAFGLLAGFIRRFFNEDINLNDLQFFSHHYNLMEAPLYKSRPQEHVVQAQTQELFTINNTQNHETSTNQLKRPQKSGLFINM